MKKVNTNIILAICISVMIIYQFSCQGKLYEKNENSIIEMQKYEQKIAISIDENQAYEKSYLGPNGLYSNIKYEKLTVIPDSIVNFSKINGQRKNELIAFWAILSNFGEYNFANNPFGISDLEIKNLEKKSSIVGSKYVYVDSINNFVQVRVRFQSFENLQKAFESFYTHKDKFNMSPKMQEKFNQIKSILDSNSYSSKIDSNKLRIFGADTVLINDSLKIMNLIKNIQYVETTQINIVLIILTTILFYRLLAKN